VGDPSRVGSPLWLELRAQAVARAKGRCEICHTPSAMLCLKVVSLRSVPLTLESVQATCAGCLHGQPPKKFERRRRQLVFRKRGAR
jgi:hypothetical protein